MRMTEHAITRKNQRGFSSFVLDIILKYGSHKSAAGGATKVFFGKREYRETVEELKRAIQLLDKAKGGSIIIKNDSVITVYK